jgi:hypothetical protein
MPPAGTDETLAFGYLFLLQQLLEHLRYRTDSGHADASRLIDDFQADVVARVEAGDVDGRMIAFVGGALHQSRIPASPELVAASASYAVESPDQGEDELLPADVRAAFGAIFEACDGDPFRVVGGLLESSHAMPAEARGELADALALAGLPEARGAAVLLLLDPDSAVRSAVAGALDQVAASLAPRDVRRLIAMRNGPRTSARKSTPSSAGRGRPGSSARDGRRAASKTFLLPPSTAPPRKVSCWYRRPDGRSGSRAS